MVWLGAEILAGAHVADEQQLAVPVIPVTCFKVALLWVEFVFPL